jgi:hypothetical protein
MSRHPVPTSPHLYFLPALLENPNVCPVNLRIYYIYEIKI